MDTYKEPIVKAAEIIANAILYLAEQIKNYTYHSTYLHDEQWSAKNRCRR